MKLNHIIAKKVNGYIDLRIEFKPTLNFLIGINGSGKTSTLKLVLGLLTPSYDFLNQIEYDFAQVVCSSSSEERDITITSKRVDGNKFTIITDIGGEVSEGLFEMINFQSIESLQAESKNELLKRSAKDFFNLEPVTKIITLNTPVFLGLSRRFESGRRDSFIRRLAIRGRYGDNQRNESIDNSLIEVQELIFDYHRYIAEQQPKITEEFKNKIFERYFNFIDDITSNRLDTNIDIEEKKKEVIEAILNLNLSGFESHISEFFDKMKAVQTEFTKFDQGKKGQLSKPEISIISKWFINSPQLYRIDHLLDLSKIYFNKLDELKKPIDKLEKIISNYFLETGKTVKVKGDGQIEVFLPTMKQSSIFKLSSGEKQIIIMIAHLIFSENLHSPGIFIIDEPEVSLHLSWQEIFVKSIVQASSQTQFILATHSPSIIGSVENEVYCHDLSPKL